MNGGNKQLPTWRGIRGRALPTQIGSLQRGMIFVDQEDDSIRDRASIAIRQADNSYALAELAYRADVDLELGEVSDALEEEHPMYAFVMATFPQGNATTWGVSGMAAPAVTATTTTNRDTPSTGPMIGLATSNVSADVAQVVLGAGMSNVRSAWDPRLAFRASTGATITDIRWWFGAFASTPSGSADPAIEGFGFRFDTGASDANWKAWSNDGAGGGTITDTLVAVAGSSAASFRIEVSATGTSIAYYINGTLVATHTTNLPATSTYLGVGGYCTALSANVREIRVGRIGMSYER